VLLLLATYACGKLATFISVNIFECFQQFEVVPEAKFRGTSDTLKNQRTTMTYAGDLILVSKFAE